jgi:DNA-binding NtrC family response regulator
MKKVLFYSPDFSLCYSLLIYLQDKYNVTSSTDFNVLNSLAEKSEFDLFIIDSEPDPKLEKLCSDIKKSSPNVKIILTYVYSKKTSAAEKRIRDYISTIFYKPFDLADITKSIPDIITESTTQAN